MKKVFICFCAMVFAVAGVYLLFFVGNTSKYDSQTRAYNIYPNESYSSDGSTYSPIYYFRVEGKEYECRTKSGSSVFL